MGKELAALAYVANIFPLPIFWWVSGAVALLAARDDNFTRTHGAQAMLMGAISLLVLFTWYGICVLLLFGILGLGFMGAAVSQDAFQAVFSMFGAFMMLPVALMLAWVGTIFIVLCNTMLSLAVMVIAVADSKWRFPVLWALAERLALSVTHAKASR